MFAELFGFKTVDQDYKLTAELVAIRERNEKRLEEAKEKLGSKWLLHPENQQRRKEASLVA